MSDSKNPAPNKNKSYSSDLPIHDIKEDKFNRWPFAQRLAETIVTRDDNSSLVIGIYGAWGDGKTSVLHLIKRALQKHTQIISVDFNPWHFQSAPQLIESFFKTLEEALGDKFTSRRKEIAKIFTNYSYLLSIPGIVYPPLMGLGLLGTLGAKFGKILSSTKLEESKKRLESILKEENTKVVVFIDDIDRLDKEEIQILFKLIKLSAGFENVIYILAFDDKMVADSLGEKYGSGSSDSGRSFLEKIIQVPLHLPRVDESSLRGMLFKNIDELLKDLKIELSEDQAASFSRNFARGFEDTLKTPRQIRLYCNALTFALPILVGEVNLVDQMLIEGVRIFYPKLYEVLKSNSAICMADNSDLQDSQNRKTYKEVIEKGFEELSQLEKESALAIATFLFPRLSGVFGPSSLGDSWERGWHNERRICSSTYFERYFQYAVPVGDISDKSVDQLFSPTATTSDINKLLNELCINQQAVEKLVGKLRHKENHADLAVIPTLTLCIAQNDGLFSRNRGMNMFFSSPKVQAAVFLAFLIQRLSTDAKATLENKIVESSQTLLFAKEFFVSLRQVEKEKGTPIEAKRETELGQLLAHRIAKEAQEHPPYIEWPDDTSTLLWIWHKYGTIGETAAYLKERLTKHPEEINNLLSSYVSTAWELESGKSHKSDFDQGAFDSLTQIIPADFIHECLKKIHKNLPDLSAFPLHLNKNEPEEQVFAQQFQFLYKNSKSAKK